MSDIPVEKKLELVHQVRSQYQKNQYDLMNRESLLYGRTSRPAEYRTGKEYTDEGANKSEASEGILRDGTIKIRYGIATLLLVIVILMDRNGKSFAGISMERLFQVMETDYGDVLAAWVQGNTTIIK